MEGASFSCLFSPPDLVFDEVQGFLHLADVMVIGAHLGQKGVGVDGLGRGLHHVADDHAVVIGAGSLNHQLPQEGLIQIGELEQLDVRRETERPSPRGEALPWRSHRPGAPCKTRNREATRSPRCRATRRSCTTERLRNDVHRHHDQAGLDENPPLAAIPHPMSRHQAADEEVDEELHPCPRQMRAREHRQDKGKRSGHPHALEIRKPAWPRRAPARQTGVTGR